MKKQIIFAMLCLGIVCVGTQVGWDDAITFSYEGGEVLRILYADANNPKVQFVYDPNKIDEAGQVFMKLIAKEYMGICIVDDSNDLTLVSSSMVRQLAESGRICEVTGHCWKEAMREIGWKRFEPYYYLKQECYLCGKKRSFEWKEMP